MNDDFNTAKAIALLFDIAKAYNNASSAGTKRELRLSLEKLGNVLGFYQNLGDKLKRENESGGGEELIELLISYRNRFKAEKNWEYADLIRDDLKKLGIILQDTPEGTKWSRDE
jgi:cysteinyl-tRNA synthetase